MAGAIKREFTASQARNQFAEVIDAALYEGPVVVRKRSRSVAIIPLELFELLTDLEDKREADQARAALREYLEQGGTPLSKLRQELGL